MSEKKHWFKELLEWLHHGYWIREFLLSSGLWSLVVLLVSKYVMPIGSHVMWPLLLLLVGGSMYLLDWLHKKHKAAPLQQVQSSTALLAGNANETLTPGVNIDEFFRLAYRSPTMEQEAQKNMRILARQKTPNNVELFYLNSLAWD